MQLIHTCTYMRWYTHTYTSVDKHMHIHALINTCICMRWYTHANTCVDTHMLVITPAKSMRTCTGYMCTHTLHVYTCIHFRTHIMITCTLSYTCKCITYMRVHMEGRGLRRAEKSGDGQMADVLSCWFVGFDCYHCHARARTHTHTHTHIHTQRERHTQTHTHTHTHKHTHTQTHTHTHTHTQTQTHTRRYQRENTNIRSSSDLSLGFNLGFSFRFVSTSMSDDAISVGVCTP